jgi:hypothetical protein
MKTDAEGLDQVGAEGVLEGGSGKPKVRESPKDYLLRLQQELPIQDYKVVSIF